MPERLGSHGMPSETDVRRASDAQAMCADVSKFSASAAFEELLRLHRGRARGEEIHFLEYLCFALDETADLSGLRFVLWHPVVLFLQHGFQVEIQEQLCDGQVSLVYLRHDAATFLNKLIPKIEAVRREYALWAVSCGPQLLLHVLQVISEDLLWSDRSTAEQVQRMLAAFKVAVRRGDYAGIAVLRAQLAELAAEGSESDVRSCVEFLRAGGGDSFSWPPHSAALASEAALARVWLTPEEELAWSHL